MNRFLSLSIFILFPLFIFNIHTQNTEKTADYHKTTYINNGGCWFIGASVGYAHLFSEYSNQVNLFDNIQPVIGASVGVWTSPVWGFRMNITGAKVRGFVPWPKVGNGYGTWYNGTNYDMSGYIHADAETSQYIYDTFLKDGIRKNNKNGEAGFLYGVPYAATSLDILLNITNLIGEYKEKRLFNFILQGGIGWAHTFRNGTTQRTALNNFFGKSGFLVDFRINPVISLNIEGQGLLLPEVFDRQVGGDYNLDFSANLMIGFSYFLKSHTFEKAKLKNQDEIAGLNEQINQLYKENKHLIQRPSSCPDCPKCVDCPSVESTNIEKENTIDYLPSPVFFRMNSAEIDFAQLKSIEDATLYLKENPLKKLKIVGYADKGTGTPESNKILSEKRAKAVYEMMVNTYQINPDCLEILYLGDSVQPFIENEWNRVVIFVTDY